MNSKSNVPLDKTNCRALIDSVDTIFADCDGVLYHMHDVVSGVPEAVHKLKAEGKRFFYVTNNSSKTRADFAKKLQSMGYPATEDDVIGSAYTTAQYLIGQGVVSQNSKAFVIGHDGLVQELRNAGITCLRPQDHVVQDIGDPAKAVEKLNLDPTVGYVVVGIDCQFDYLKACMVALYLKNPKCKFIATNSDSSIPVAKGINLPGAGSILAMISTATSRQPDVICGKPHEPMFDVVKEKYSVNPSNTLMIGDRLETDILFAGRCGLKSLLVLTGSSSLKDVEALQQLQQQQKTTTNHLPASSDIELSIPHYHLPSLADLAQLL